MQMPGKKSHPAPQDLRDVLCTSLSLTLPSLGLVAAGFAYLLETLSRTAWPPDGGRFVDTPWFALGAGVLAWALLSPLPSFQKRLERSCVPLLALELTALWAGLSLSASFAFVAALLALIGLTGTQAIARLLALYSQESLWVGAVNVAVSALLGSCLFALVSLVDDGISLPLSMLVALVGTALAMTPPASSVPCRKAVTSREHLRQSALFVKESALSSPFLFTLLWGLTTGTRLDCTGAVSPCVPPLFLAALTIAVFACHWATRASSAKLSFILFRVVLPTYACLALALKVIPVSSISGTAFKAVMSWDFEAAVLLLWAYASYAAANRQQDTSCVLAATIGAVGLILALGLLLTLLDESVKFGLLGVATSAFLLYEALSLGNAAVESVRPAESDEDGPREAPDLAARCAAVAERHGLTSREAEVLVEIAGGHSSKYVAEVLCVTPNTVRSHTKNIYSKLGVTSRDGMLEMVQRRGGASPTKTDAANPSSGNRG